VKTATVLTNDLLLPLENSTRKPVFCFLYRTRINFIKGEDIPRSKARVEGQVTSLANKKMILINIYQKLKE
jgi:hypothetical protein